MGKLGKVLWTLLLLCISDLPDDHPRITGVNEQYEPGEGITATCTAWHSNPPANLSWFINGEPVSTAEYIIDLHTQICKAHARACQVSCLH